jgi:hypothetical protein
MLVILQIKAVNHKWWHGKDGEREQIIKMTLIMLSISGLLALNIARHLI